MKKVTAYTWVTMDRVQGLINEGWQPWGSPSQYYQAMVMYEESPIQDMGPK